MVKTSPSGNFSKIATLYSLFPRYVSTSTILAFLPSAFALLIIMLASFLLPTFLDSINSSEEYWLGLTVSLTVTFSPCLEKYLSLDATRYLKFFFINGSVIASGFLASSNIPWSIVPSTVVIRVFPSPLVFSHLVILSKRS